ncbi:MAG: hypothetical protein Roseis2KO_21340 [Roseivirga sp.]
MEKHQARLILRETIRIMILGVSGWFGEKIGLTEKQTRLAFVLAFLLAGFGLGLYIILWIVKMFSK